MTQQQIEQLESVLNAYIASPSPELAGLVLPIIREMAADLKAPAILYGGWLFIPGETLLAFPQCGIAVLKRWREDDPPGTFPRDAV